MSHEPTWDLDTPAGGPIDGPAFSARVATMQAAIDAIKVRAKSLSSLADAPEAWSALIRDSLALEEAAGELDTLASCAVAANTKSATLKRAEAGTRELSRGLEAADVPLGAALSEASDEVAESFFSRPELADAAPMLRNRRASAALQDKRPLRELVVNMEREAIHGWGELYDEVSGNLEVDFDRGQGVERLSIAQVAPLRAHPDEAMRHAAFDAGETAWRTIAPTCAAALTHITGHRQQILDRLGLDPLAHTLHENRIDRGTLDAILAASDALRPTLVKYLDQKAAFIGKPKLDWWDLDAPLGQASAPLSWEEAERSVIEAFSSFTPRFADFATKALKGKWVEAEDRGGKRPGAFCAGLSKSKQSRVFLTYSGTLDNAITLAHELGHAYHNEVLFDAPSVRRHITSATAETASTFAEAVVRNHLATRSGDRELELAMVDQDLQSGVVFLMNIPARFHFERGLYDLRREGPFSPAQLNAHMRACQERAYHGALGEWSEMFWANRLHFYISSFGFYNWPYTFGYLFSGAVHARAMAEGEAFLPTFHALLQRTGWDDTANLAREVLGWDLRDPNFWIDAARPLEAKLARFTELTSAS